MASFLTTPADVIKTRIQTHSRAAQCSSSAGAEDVTRVGGSRVLHLQYTSGAPLSRLHFLSHSRRRTLALSRR